VTMVQWHGCLSVCLSVTVVTHSPDGTTSTITSLFASSRCRAKSEINHQLESVFQLRLSGLNSQNFRLMKMPSGLISGNSPGNLNEAMSVGGSQSMSIGKFPSRLEIEKLTSLFDL